MILIVTHTKDLSADLVIRHLRAAKTDFLRLNTDHLGTPECHFGFDDRSTLTVGGQRFVQSDFGAIWARRFANPTTPVRLDVQYRNFVRRETGVLMDAFLETATCYQMNKYIADRLAGNRLIQSQRATNVGLRVPSSCATQDRAEAEAFLISHPHSVIKALSFGRLTDTLESAAEPIAYTTAISAGIDWSGLEVGPVFLQARIEGRFEWRITTVGERVFAARTPSTGHIDWRNRKVPAVFEESGIPSGLTEMLLRLCRDSNIVYGAHDLIETPEGEFVFLETNPAGQWGWLEAGLGQPIGRAIATELVAGHG